MTAVNDFIKEIIGACKFDYRNKSKGVRTICIAVKCFQDNWNIDATDFADMLERAFAKSNNALNMVYIGHGRTETIIRYAKLKPEAVRRLFQTLYDEKLPLDFRILDFVDGIKSGISQENLESTGWVQTHSTIPTIIAYLTFMYPENYYIYSNTILDAWIDVFGIELRGDYVSIYTQTYTQICDSIHEVATADEELIAMNHKTLGNNCYQDPNNRMLVLFIAIQNCWIRDDVVESFESWLKNSTHDNGKPYDPQLVETYLKLIKDEAKKLVPPYDGNTNLFTYVTSKRFTPQLETLEHIISSDKIQVDKTYHNVLHLYEQFLKDYWEQWTSPILPILTKPPIRHTAYSRAKFLEEVFLTADDYDSLKNQLLRKKNLILQGPPGVGKTFAAKRLVYSLIGEKISERICFVQFHQSYGYEDFVMGYRPDDSGFKMQYGSFYVFCKKAEVDPENDWFFIIDEINRGNISKIFGELLMLIESDKRSKDYAVRLQGTEEPFYVPDNVYIIGMMNTADRSIALIDYALRRRFAFYTLEPAFENETFRNFVGSKNSKKFNTIIEQISKLNDEIAKDPLLGTGYKIGHSYFCIDNDSMDDNLLRDIILYEITPLLSEYWVDNADKIKDWTNKLLGATK